MLKKYIVFIVVMLGISSNLHADKADDIIKKYVKAKGTVTKLENYKSLHLVVEQSSQGMTGEMKMVSKGESHLRIELDAMGQKQVTATNGKTAWIKMGDQINDVPIKNLMQMSAVLNLIVKGPILSETMSKDCKTKITYEGKSKYQKNDVHNLKITSTRNGITNEAYSYIDAKSFKLLKSWTKSEVAGQSITTELFFDNEKKFAGISIPSEIIVTQGNINSTMKIKSLKFDTKVNSDIFEKPVSTIKK